MIGILFKSLFLTFSSLIVCPDPELVVERVCRNHNDSEDLSTMLMMRFQGPRCTCVMDLAVTLEEYREEKISRYGGVVPSLFTTAVAATFNNAIHSIISSS